jgi:hypothetical protein
MQEEALRDLVKIVMGSECADSNLLRNIVELFLFLWKKQLRSGGGNGGGVSVATAALRNPACPTDLLHRALFSKNAAYCLAASQNPNLPEEDQVQWALTPRKRYQPL